jgi:Family of unknown function (DUF6516)
MVDPAERSVAGLSSGPDLHVVKGICVLRYDNEAGKGDHKHVGPIETDYRFTTHTQLLADFWRDVDQWRPE